MSSLHDEQRHGVPSISAETATLVNTRTRNGEIQSNDDGTKNTDDALHLLQGAALLTADCLGTGILALPADMIVLGRALGITFLLLNLPINLYAGTILSNSAAIVEERAGYADADADADADAPTTTTTKRINNFNQTTYSSIQEQVVVVDDDITFHDEPSMITNKQHKGNDDTATFDFIGMTQALFDDDDESSSSYNATTTITRIVMCLYYCNIFLVLGDYILVMSHAVAALVGEHVICIPTAGLIASTLMFAVSQLRTMAKLGRIASLVSLTALFVVVIQCLVALSTSNDGDHGDGTSNNDNVVGAAVDNNGLIPKFSALASIGFATGSQKLFLNIRHEMKHRQEAPKALGISLSFYVAVYVFICVMAGPNPPSFLFDAIAPGWNRRLGGLLLWIHVVVSYAINSQAICSSMDRLFFHDVIPSLKDRPALRWMVLTCGMSISSYLVANAIPFFKDLVALIGALTSVPLTLMMPAIFYRKATFFAKSWWWPNVSLSYALLVFAVVFTILGLIGAVTEIELDWKSHGPPFSCR